MTQRGIPSPASIILVVPAHRMRFAILATGIRLFIDRDQKRSPQELMSLKLYHSSFRFHTAGICLVET